MFFMFRRVYLRYRVFIVMSATIIVCFIQGIQFMNEISETDILAQIRSEMNIHFRKEEKCKPKHQIVFAKTHKTGSSTFQNILFRHCLQNNLTIAFPTAKSWMFGFKKSFSANQVNGYELEQNKHTTYTTFDMFLFHSVWNYSEVRKVVPYGPSVTLIRDPVDTFESGYVYFNNHPKDINEFVMSKLNSKTNKERRPNSQWPKLNQLLFDFGMSDEKLEEDVTYVKRKIAELDHQFDLVLISEEMLKGLVLLKDLMCWETEDVTFLKQNERKAVVKRGMSNYSRRKLKEWLWAEYMIYDHFVEKFQNQTKNYINRFGNKTFYDEVEKLENANKQIYSECVVSHTDNEHGLKGQYKMALGNVLGYKVNENKTWCSLYAITEPPFTRLLRARQFPNEKSRSKKSVL